MVEESISIKAVNSSQDMEFFIQKDVTDGEEEYYFTLCGEYRGEKDIQVDFDFLTPDEFRAFIAKCYKLLKREV